MTTPTEERILAHGEQLATLLPPGRAWGREPGGARAALLAAFGAEYAQLEARVLDLVREFDPTRTLELLREWEDALGLPDPCVGQLATLEERRGAVVARLATLAGGSAVDLQALAAALGYEVRVRSHRAFRAGRSRAGDALTNYGIAFRAGRSRAGQRLAPAPAWPFTVDVIAPLTTVRRFTAGRSAAGERLATWNNALLECTLSRVAPAHVLLRFLYELRQQLAAPVTSTVTAVPFLFTLLFEPEAFDLIAHERIVLVNAVSPLTGELWNLDTTATTPISLPPAFVPAELLKNGGRITWMLSGAYVNATGSPIDLELALYAGDAAATPFCTVCVEGMPSAVGSNGNFNLQMHLQIRNTGQAHGAFLMIANPLVVADGSTGSGQAAAFLDYDVLRMWSTINWNNDTLVVAKLRKKTASAALVNTYEVQCVADVLRSGTGAT